MNEEKYTEREIKMRIGWSAAKSYLGFEQKRGYVRSPDKLLLEFMRGFMEEPEFQLKELDSL